MGQSHHWLRLAIFGPVLSNYLKSKFIGIYEKGTNRKTLDSLKAFNLKNIWKLILL